MVEAHAGIDRQPLAYRHSVGREERGGNELPAVDAGTPRDRLKGLLILVNEPGPGRNDLGLAMLTLLDLHADLPFVIGPKQPALVVRECRLARRANQCQTTDLPRSAAVCASYLVEPVRRCEVTGTRVVFLGIDKASK